MRVLQVLHVSAPMMAGYTIRSSYIFQNLTKMGIEVGCLTSMRQAGDYVPKETVDGLPHWRTPPLRRPLRAVNELQAMAGLTKRLWQVIREWRPDVIHAHSPVLVGMPALAVAKAAGIPLVYEVRDLWENASVDRGKFAVDSVPYRAARGLDTVVLRGADAVVTICEAQRAEIEPRAGKPVTVAANGVDVSEFAVSEEAQAQARSTRPTVAYIGTFQPYEGIETLIKAMPFVVERIPDARLVITGGGGNEQDLRALSAQVSKPGSVEFTGRVPHDQVTNYYLQADVLAYPRIDTRTTRLTTPLKPLEAMALRKAVVVSDLPALRELIHVGETGVTFPAGNERALADVLVSLLQDPARREELGRKARAQVEQERDWAAIVARYKQVYESVLRGKQA